MHAEWHRAEPRPFVARAYGGVVIDDRRRVLLREPTNHFGGYCWTFAKGGADEGESPSDAALREVREETGWACEAIAEIDGWFVGTTSDTKFFLMAPLEDHGDFHHETASVRWASFEEAAELIAQTTVGGGRERDLAVLAAAAAMLSHPSGRVGAR
ncbi:NUDIX hydrolase [Gemmatimonadota bacterium Y43]|uniref:NUDIX hydrolase n=1 Tax=Gaopeijia maritima TaxID=3119007 RepID=UPI00326A7E69